MFLWVGVCVLLLVVVVVVVVRERGERFCVFLWVGVRVCVLRVLPCALGPDLCIADADHPFDGGKALRRKDAATGMSSTTASTHKTLTIMPLLFIAPRFF